MEYNYNSLRFGNNEETIFPEVIDYDFTSNNKVRGSADTSFTWKEVYINANYLLREVTASGSFEYTYLTGSISTGEVLITNPTQSYSGWMVTGSSAYHIGISGSYFSGLSEWAYPIVSNNAILLNATGSDVLVQMTGITISNMPEDRQYQAYVVARALSGSSSIKMYTTANTGGGIGLYYDTITSSWIPTEPTGTYTVGSTGYTEILYKFYTSNITGITLDSFNFVLEQPSGQSGPVIIDELHLDEVLIRNPYVDYFIPTGYIIQITPDLGWHSITDMFDSSSIRNPHIRTLGIYSVAAGNLNDNLDGSVTATVDATGFYDAMIPTFSKYYWRATAVSPNGELGKAGLPQRFSYIGSLLNSEFTVDEVQSDVFSLTKIVVGKKPIDSVVLINNQTNAEVTYPTQDSWRYVYNLQSDEITLAFKARANSGATSSTKYITLTNKTYSQISNAIWNVIDEHGLLVDLDRLPNESNIDFTNRIKDVFINPGSSNFYGLVNGATRELGLDKISQAVEIKIKNNGFNTTKSISADIEVTAYSLRIRTETYVKEETLLIDPVYSCVYINDFPKTIESIVLEDGTNLNKNDYKLVISEDESPSKYKILLDERKNLGQYVIVRYSYYDELMFSTYSNLASLINRLNTMVDPSGSTYLTCKLNKRLSGGEECLGLYKDSIIIPRGSAGYLEWSPIFINRISDRNYREYYTAAGKQYYESEYYKKILGLKNEIKIFWGNVECDRDYWGISSSVKNSLDHIPTVTDPVKHNYIVSVTGKLDKDQAWSRNYIGPSGETIQNRGISFSYFQPGVGYKNDLKPDIYVADTKSSQEKSSLPVSSVKNNNSYVYFTGQK